MEQIVAPRPSLDIFKTATDSLMLPLRRPILFVPFIFTMAVVIVLILMVFVGAQTNAPGPARMTMQQIGAMIASVVLILLTVVLTTETTMVLTARAELGRELDLGDAVVHVLTRFPVTLVTTAVMSVAITVGMMLLIIPGLIVMLRWFLAPNAVLLGGRGVREAIGLSWQMTGAHAWALSGLVLLVVGGTFILSIPLALLPVAGPLAASWIGFAWGGMALTMAYVRLGGPVDLG